MEKDEPLHSFLKNTGWSCDDLLQKLLQIKNHRSGNEDKKHEDTKNEETQSTSNLSKTEDKTTDKTNTITYSNEEELRSSQDRDAVEVESNKIPPRVNILSVHSFRSQPVEDSEIANDIDKGEGTSQSCTTAVKDEQQSKYLSDLETIEIEDEPVDILHSEKAGPTDTSQKTRSQDNDDETIVIDDDSDGETEVANASTSDTTKNSTIEGNVEEGRCKDESDKIDSENVIVIEDETEVANASKDGTTEGSTIEGNVEEGRCKDESDKIDSGYVMVVENEIEVAYASKDGTTEGSTIEGNVEEGRCKDESDKIDSGNVIVIEDETEVANASKDGTTEVSTTQGDKMDFGSVIVIEDDASDRSTPDLSDYEDDGLKEAKKDRTEGTDGKGTVIDCDCATQRDKVAEDSSENDVNGTIKSKHFFGEKPLASDTSESQTTNTAKIINDGSKNGTNDIIKNKIDVSAYTLATEAFQSDAANNTTQVFDVEANLEKISAEEGKITQIDVSDTVKGKIVPKVKVPQGDTAKSTTQALDIEAKLEKIGVEEVNNAISGSATEIEPHTVSIEEVIVTKCYSENDVNDTIENKITTKVKLSQSESAQAEGSKINTEGVIVTKDDLKKDPVENKSIAKVKLTYSEITRSTTQAKGDTTAEEVLVTKCDSDNYAKDTVENNIVLEVKHTQSEVAKDTTEIKGDTIITEEATITKDDSKNDANNKAKSEIITEVNLLNLSKTEDKTTDKTITITYSNEKEFISSQDRNVVEVESNEIPPRINVLSVHSFRSQPIEDSEIANDADKGEGTSQSCKTAAKDDIQSKNLSDLEKIEIEEEPVDILHSEEKYAKDTTEKRIVLEVKHNQGEIAKNTAEIKGDTISAEEAIATKGDCADYANNSVGNKMVPEERLSLSETVKITNESKGATLGTENLEIKDDSKNDPNTKQDKTVVTVQMETANCTTQARSDPNSFEEVTVRKDDFEIDVDDTTESKIVSEVKLTQSVIAKNTTHLKVDQVSAEEAIIKGNFGTEVNDTSEDEIVPELKLSESETEETISQGEGDTINVEEATATKDDFGDVDDTTEVKLTHSEITKNSTQAKDDTISAEEAIITKDDSKNDVNNAAKSEIVTEVNLLKSETAKNTIEAKGDTNDDFEDHTNTTSETKTVPEVKVSQSETAKSMIKAECHITSTEGGMLAIKDSGSGCNDTVKSKIIPEAIISRCETAKNTTEAKGDTISSGEDITTKDDSRTDSNIIKDKIGTSQCEIADYATRAFSNEAEVAEGITDTKIVSGDKVSQNKIVKSTIKVKGVTINIEETIVTKDANKKQVKTIDSSQSEMIKNITPVFISEAKRLEQAEIVDDDFKNEPANTTEMKIVPEVILLQGDGTIATKADTINNEETTVAKEENTTETRCDKINSKEDTTLTDSDSDAVKDTIKLKIKERLMDEFSDTDEEEAKVQINNSHIIDEIIEDIRDDKVIEIVSDDDDDDNFEDECVHDGSGQENTPGNDGDNRQKEKTLNLGDNSLVVQDKHEEKETLKDLSSHEGEERLNETSRKDSMSGFIVTEPDQDKLHSEESSRTRVKDKVSISSLIQGKLNSSEDGTGGSVQDNLQEEKVPEAGLKKFVMSSFIEKKLKERAELNKAGDTATRKMFMNSVQDKLRESCEVKEVSMSTLIQKRFNERVNLTEIDNDEAVRKNPTNEVQDELEKEETSGQKVIDKVSMTDIETNIDDAAETKNDKPDISRSILKQNKLLNSYLDNVSHDPVPPPTSLQTVVSTKLSVDVVEPPKEYFAVPAQPPRRSLSISSDTETSPDRGTMRSVEDIRMNLKLQLNSLRSRKKQHAFQQVTTKINDNFLTDNPKLVNKPVEEPTNKVDDFNGNLYTQTNELGLVILEVRGGVELDEPAVPPIETVPEVANQDDGAVDLLREIINKKSDTGGIKLRKDLAKLPDVENLLVFKQSDEQNTNTDSGGHSQNAPFVSNVLEEFLTGDAQLNISYKVPKCGAEEGLKQVYVEDTSIVVKKKAEVKSEDKGVEKKASKVKARTVAQKRKLLEKAFAKEKLKKRKEEMNKNRSYVIDNEKKLYVKSLVSNKCIVNLDEVGQKRRKKLCLLQQKSDEKKPSVRLKYLPGPMCKKPFLHTIHHQQWETVVNKLPSVFVEVVPRLGEPLPPEVSDRLNFGYDLDENRIEFALTALKTDTPALEPARKFVFPIPYHNNQQQIVAMKRRKPQEVIEKPISHVVSDDVIANVIDDLIRYVEIKELAPTLIKEDDYRFDDVEKVVESKEHVPDQNVSVLKRPHKRRSKVDCELIRLSCKIVNVEVENDDDPINCNKPHCRLGCVCKSLRCDNSLIFHCRNERCMFSCTCPKEKHPVYEHKVTLPAGTNVLSTDTVSRIEDEAKKHLAKVEREFTQTIIQTDNRTIVVGAGSRSKTRRAAQMPKNYSELEEESVPATPPDQKQADFSMNCLVRLPRLDLDSIVPLCLQHEMYNCSCGGKSKYRPRSRQPAVEEQAEVEPEVSSRQHQGKTYQRRDLSKPYLGSRFKRKKSIDSEAKKKVNEEQPEPETNLYSVVEEVYEPVEQTSSGRQVRSKKSYLDEHVTDGCARTDPPPIKRRKLNESAVCGDFIFNTSQADILRIKINSISKNKQMLEVDLLKQHLLADYLSEKKAACQTPPDSRSTKRKQILEVRKDDQSNRSSAADTTSTKPAEKKRKPTPKEPRPVFDGEIIIDHHSQELLRKMGPKTVADGYARLLPWKMLTKSFKEGSVNIWSMVDQPSRLLINKSDKKAPKNYVNIKDTRQTTEVIMWILRDKLPVTYDEETVSFILRETKDNFEICGVCTKHLNGTTSTMESPEEFVHRNLQGKPMTLLIELCRPKLQEVVEESCLPLGDSSVDKNKQYMWAALPEIGDDWRWRMVLLNNDFSYLYFKRDQYSIKYMDLVVVSQRAKAKSSTLVLYSDTLRSGRENPGFGIYFDPNYPDNMFIGPYHRTREESDGDVDTIRYFNKRLVYTENFNRMTGRSDYRSGYWMLERPYGTPTIDLTRDEVLETPHNESVEGKTTSDPTPQMQTSGSQSKQPSSAELSELLLDATEDSKFSKTSEMTFSQYNMSLTRGNEQIEILDSHPRKPEDFNRYVITNIPNFGYLGAYQHEGSQKIDVSWPFENKLLRFPSVQVAAEFLQDRYSALLLPVPETFKIHVIIVNHLDTKVNSPVDANVLSGHYICGKFGYYNILKLSPQGCLSKLNKSREEVLKMFAKRAQMMVMKRSETLASLLQLPRPTDGPSILRVVDKAIEEINALKHLEQYMMKQKKELAERKRVIATALYQKGCTLPDEERYKWSVRLREVLSSMRPRQSETIEIDDSDDDDDDEMGPPVLEMPPAPVERCQSEEIPVLEKQVPTPEIRTGEPKHTPADSPSTTNQMPPNNPRSVLKTLDSRATPVVMKPPSRPTLPPPTFRPTVQRVKLVKATNGSFVMVPGDQKPPAAPPSPIVKMPSLATGVKVVIKNSRIQAISKTNTEGGTSIETTNDVVPHGATVKLTKIGNLTSEAVSLLNAIGFNDQTTAQVINGNCDSNVKVVTKR